MLAENATDMITRHDEKGRVIFASQASQQLLGEAPEKLTGDGLFERVHVADRPAYLTALSDAARGGARKPLSLQRTVESGHLRQNFSHGRSKSVVVEKRRTRKLAGPGEAEAPVEETKPEPMVAKPRPGARPGSAPARGTPSPGAASAVSKTLSDEERDARAKALAAARVRDDAERDAERVRLEVVASQPPPAARRANRKRPAPRTTAAG